MLKPRFCVSLSTGTHLRPNVEVGRNDNQITSNFGFSIPYLYIHDHDLEQASGTLTCGVFMYVPPIWQSVYILWYSASIG